MARYSQIRGRTGAHENGKHVSEPIAGAKRLVVFPWLGHSDFTGKMALLADAVPLAGRKLSRIEHRFAESDVIAARPVASLTRYAAFAERRRSIGVLRAWNSLSPACMAFEAPRQDGPRQIRVVDIRISGRRLPGCG